MTTLRRRLTGLVYLLVTFALVIGIPLALWAFRGNPIPNALPDFDQIKTALTEQDNGDLFLGFVTWIGWLAWLSFAVSIIVELAAALRGIKPPRLRGLGLQQRGASVLIGGALLLITAGTATAQPLIAGASPALTTPAHSAPVTVEKQQQLHPAQHPARPLVAETVTVQQGDSLWKLAEEHLGDGFRYKEIKELNADVITNDGWLKPGWQLSLPAAAPNSVEGAYTVQHGDSLWTIAERYLGDGNRYAEIVNVDGTLTSTTIHEGQQLKIGVSAPAQATEQPAPVAGPIPSAVDPVVEPAPVPAPELATPEDAPVTEPESVAPSPVLGGTDVPEQPEMVPGGDEQTQTEAAAAAAAAAKIFGIELNSVSSPVPAAAPAPVAEPAPVPVAEPAAAPVAEPAPMPAAEPAPRAPIPTAIPLDSESNGSVQIQAAASPSDDAQNENSTLWLGISALAAVGLAGAFGLRRHRQQHGRRRGERIPETTGRGALVEEQIHSAADDNVLLRLDTALRAVAEHARSTGTPLPALLGVFVGTDAVELVTLDDPSLPTPWIKSTETGAWTLPFDARIAPAPAAVSPYPALVTLGSADGNTQFLLNLEELGHLSISARPEHALGALQALALELVESPLADNLHLTLIGFGHELPELFGNGRIEYVDNPDDVLARLARQAKRDQNTLVEQHIDSIAEARSIYETSEMTAPEVILVAEPLTPDQQYWLDQILTSTPRVAFAAVTPSTEPPSAAWELDIVDRNVASLIKRDAEGGFTFQPAFLEPEQYAGITAYLSTATAPSIPTESSVHDHWAAAEVDAELTSPNHTLAYLDTVTPTDDTDRFILERTDTPVTSLDATEIPSYAPDATYWTPPEALVDEPRSETAPATPAASQVPASGHLWLHVLGKPTVTTLSGQPPKDGREVLLTEIAALLSIHPGIKHDAIDKKVWPADNFDKMPPEEQPKKKATRRQNYLSRLRNWLGETEGGDQAFPKHGDRTGRTGYRLHPDVRSDWDYWQQLIDTTPSAASDAELRAAAELVTGQPFAGTRADRYGWARNLQQHMISTLTDALEELATRHIKTGDLAAALTAANRGIAVEPYREGLWRLAIIATHGSDEISTTQELIDQMLANLADIDVDPEPETDELLRALSQFHSGGDRVYRIGAIAS